MAACGAGAQQVSTQQPHGGSAQALEQRLVNRPRHWNGPWVHDAQIKMSFLFKSSLPFIQAKK